MAEKKIVVGKACVIKYEAKPVKDGKINATVEFLGSGFDVLVGIKSIIEDICRETGTPVSTFLEWLGILNVPGTTIDASTIKSILEENGHE